MADDLTISGGGSTAVATAELFEHERTLAAVAADLDHCRMRLADIDRAIGFAQVREANLPVSAAFAERRIDEAVAEIGWALVTARMLVASLGASAEAYGLAERGLQQLSQVLAARVAYALGLIPPGLALLFAPLAASSAFTLAAGYSLLNPEGKAEATRRLLENNELLSDPRTVALVRLGMMSIDDFGAGAMKLSPQLATLLGDEGLGLLGLTSSASILIGVARPFGALAETPVSVDRVSTRTLRRPVDSFAARADRIPQGQAQIRIDRYSFDGQPDRFEVFIGGTRDFGVVPDGQPWDMTSNAAGLSMGDAGSYRAAEEAMRMAGIDANSPVQLVGHSQGAMVAAGLVASGEYNARGLFTVGGVVPQGLVPDGVPWLAIEHTDDLVPALAGTRSAPEAVLVRREALAGAPIPSDTLLPAHELTRYRETAALVDASKDGRTSEVLSRFNQLGTGATEVTSYSFLARRVPGP